MKNWLVHFLATNGSTFGLIWGGKKVGKILGRNKFGYYNGSEVSLYQPNLIQRIVADERSNAMYSIIRF